MLAHSHTDSRSPVHGKTEMVVVVVACSFVFLSYKIVHNAQRVRQMQVEAHICTRATTTAFSDLQIKQFWDMCFNLDDYVKSIWAKAVSFLQHHELVALQ